MDIGLIIALCIVSPVMALGWLGVLLDALNNHPPLSKEAAQALDRFDWLHSKPHRDRVWFSALLEDLFFELIAKHIKR